MATVLVSSWDDGLLSLTPDGSRSEFSGRSVVDLTTDPSGRVLGILDGSLIARRSVDGTWTVLAESSYTLSSLLPVGNVVLCGTEDAHILVLSGNGELQLLDGFERTPERDSWFAGSAVVDGQVVGPPLQVRSLTATADGSALLAVVHVGGIPRSTDEGESWHPTLEVMNDAHEVVAHPVRAEWVAAATAVGLALSEDGGVSWSTYDKGLHAPYCSSVCFCSGRVYVTVSTDHFVSESAVYWLDPRMGTDLTRVRGLPEWLPGIVDTGCLKAKDTTMGLVSAAGSIYLSADCGETWTKRTESISHPSGLCIL